LTVFAVLIVLGLFLHPGPGQSETCALLPQHGGEMFPVEKIAPEWACRLHLIITNYTTANKVGPIRTPLPERLYRALLDHPPMAAALVNRLGLAPYQAAMRGANQFWGNDGEGTEGLVQLVNQDSSTRIYYLDGFHISTYLPHISGKVVILIKMNPIRESDGSDAVDTTLISYIRLDNRFLSGLLSLVRPLVGGGVTRKLMRAMDVANRLSQEMRQHPDRVLREAVAAPSLPADNVAFLKEAMATPHNPSDSSHQKPTNP
jgi:hypothetical protein